MTRSRSIAEELLYDIAQRVTTHPGPTWPISILDAEADLASRFLDHMYEAFTATHGNINLQEDVGLVNRLPTRIVEFTYFLLGAEHSGLSMTDRSRLAEMLATALVSARPRDPLCRQGGNVLLSPAELATLVDAQTSVVGNEGRAAMAAARASLLSLAEFEHVGVPQYGREVHGPYPVGTDRFVLVRDHVELRIPDLLPATSNYPFDQVRIAETYIGPPALVKFDISNHIITSVTLNNRIISAAILVGLPDGTVRTVSPEEIIEPTAGIHAHLRRECASNTPDDWLRLHHRSRYRMLQIHVRSSGASWQPPLEARLDPLPEAERRRAPRYLEMGTEALFEGLLTVLGMRGV